MLLLLLLLSLLLSSLLSLLCCCSCSSNCFCSSDCFCSSSVSCSSRSSCFSCPSCSSCSSCCICSSCFFVPLVLIVVIVLVLVVIVVLVVVFLLLVFVFSCFLFSCSLVFLSFFSLYRDPQSSLRTCGSPPSWQGVWYLYRLLHLFTSLAGWWFQPLWKILVSWDDEIPDLGKNKKCSKPPTSWLFFYQHCFQDFEGCCTGETLDQDQLGRTFPPSRRGDSQPVAQWNSFLMK